VSVSPDQLRRFAVEIRSPGYWRVVFCNPPINLLNSSNIVELGDILDRITEADDLRVA
jgi:hypothetical protein